MADCIVISKASLFPDPDDSSIALVSLAAGDRVSQLRELSSWAKVSYTDKAVQTYLGWLHADMLKIAQATAFKLYDEPLGTPRPVSGSIIEERAQLPPWKKVRIRLEDGSAAEGWIDTNDLPAGGSGDAGGEEAEGPGSDAGDELSLGPNEVYRAPLLKAHGITDIDAAALASLIDAEAAKLPSGQWNSNSKAGTSSAAGLTQFLDSTWTSHATNRKTLLNQICKARGFIDAGNDIVTGRRQALLDLRFDPELAIVSAAEYGLFNLGALIAEGLVDDQIGDDEKARFIYIAHHEGLGGAQAFLKQTRSYTFSDLVTQIGRSKAQSYVDAAGGDTTRAYRAWLNDYVDSHIVPAKFRKSGTAAEATGGGTTALSQFNGAAIAVAELGGKTGLVKAIQWRLSELGFLDPPADGKFGPVSLWALSEFCDLNGISLGGGFSSAIARRLLEPTALLPEIATTGTWFDKVIAYMKAQKYFICRHPDCKNIAYLEGVNADGTLNDDRHNVFNDLRIVFAIDKNGRPDFEDSLWEGTTEPGDFWTIHPMNPKGAARIAFNQYKAWAVGTHHAGSPSAHEALVQAEPLSVFRDLDKDFQRTGDRLDTGLFAINQHWGYDAPQGDLGRTSAGCLVGRTKNGHRQFMTLIKADPRYGVNRGYKFLSAIMPGDKVLQVG